MKKKYMMRRSLWVSSRDKWRKVVQKTKKKEMFGTYWGFEDLAVWAGCGYCDGFSLCTRCPLSEGRWPICRSSKSSKSVASDYLNLMVRLWELPLSRKTNKKEWAKALELAKKVLAAIEDKKNLEVVPDKEW